MLKKVFNEIQHALMIKKKKTLTKVGIQDTYLKIIKVIYDKSQSM